MFLWFILATLVQPAALSSFFIPSDFARLSNYGISRSQTVQFGLCEPQAPASLNALQVLVRNQDASGGPPKNLCDGSGLPAGLYEFSFSGSFASPLKRAGQGAIELPMNYAGLYRTQRTFRAVGILMRDTNYVLFVCDPSPGFRRSDLLELTDEEGPVERRRVEGGFPTLSAPGHFGKSSVLFEVTAEGGAPLVRRINGGSYFLPKTFLVGTMIGGRRLKPRPREKHRQSIVRACEGDE